MRYLSIGKYIKISYPGLYCKLIKIYFFARKILQLENKEICNRSFITSKYGELNDGVTFYVIRRFKPMAGFFSNYHHVLGHIMIALEKGYIPMIDMENYKTFYNEDKPINESNNAWEYYFKQPFDFTLGDVYKSKNVILSDGLYPNDRVNFNFSFITNKKKLEKHYRIMTKYMVIRPEIELAINHKFENLFGNKSKILGVLSRGTDMKTSMASKHKMMPTENYLISKVKELINKWNQEWIYLVMEEMSVIESFKTVFGNKIIVSDSLRINKYDEKTPVPRWKFDRDNDNYLKGLEYLVDIVLLSRCDSIICPITNGSIAAIEMNNNKFGEKYIIDLGTNK